MNEPNEESFTVSPFSRQSVISFNTSSTKADDSVRDSPTFWKTASHRSTHVTVFPVPVIACPALSANKLYSKIMSLNRDGQQHDQCKRMQRCRPMRAVSLTQYLPAQQCRAPGEAAAHGFQQHQ